MTKEEEYLKVKNMVLDYEKEMNISNNIEQPFSKLSSDDKLGIHETLFQMDILKLDDDDKIEEYYDKLPNEIISDGIRWGFQDSVVMDNMAEWFENNLDV